MSGPADEGFLSRWSKRKLQDPEDLPPQPDPGDVEEAEADATALEEKTDAEILEELGLPDPDELREGDDFSGFMKGAVPTRLRNRALRKLWLTNPVLANLDEMVDYGEDFTDAATVVENLQTAYQVGKGWLPDEPAEDEADDAEAGADVAGEAASDASDDNVTDAGTPRDQDTVATGTEADALPQSGDLDAAAFPQNEKSARAGAATEVEAPIVAQMPEDAHSLLEDVVEAAPPPRRMRFRFDTG